MPFLLGRNNSHVRFPSEQRTAPEREHDPLNELDEYGTELHKEARVWKVYVKETDQYDGDLVKGWNDSTDVILVFFEILGYSPLSEFVQAALFSAISTAFLIESSKMLQEDPATVSAQTLQVISQTLLLVSNGTQLSGPASPPSGNPAQFIPSRSAIWVKTLWYLSLSLSLATSFIAILAKDWCHSFMHGRTGHPYLQTRQRQQKWDMIERWKMPELLAALPSIIHLALFLFAFGLCIFLWNTHLVVALPVLCVSGVAFGFYACSSIAAIFLDFFPYPTILSRICRTEIAKQALKTFYELPVSLALMLGLALWSPFVLVLKVSRSIYFRLPGPLDYPFGVVYHLLGRWNERVVGGPIGWLKSRSPTTLWLLKLIFTRRSQTSSDGDNVTSLALGWLITFCEVPQSVDIALQSIAGATNRITHQPLVDCKAALEILRRLASENLYRGLDTKSEAIVSLYVRALSFLGTSANPNTVQKKGSELEASIWDLQAETEKKVAALIEEGDFEPTQSNLDALRIGSTVASTILKILQNELGDSLVITIFDSIAGLLRSHLDHTTKLHDAALLSVTHAATLLLLFTPESIATRQNDSDIPLELLTICRNYPALFGERDYVDAHPLLSQCIELAKRQQSGLVTSLVTTCIILYNTHEDQTRPATLTWSEEVVQALIQRCSQDDVDLERIYNIEPPGISAPEETYDLKDYFSRLDGILLSNNPPDTPIAQTGRGTSRELDEKVVSVQLHALSSIYHLTSTTMLSPVIYVLVVEVMCRTPSSSPPFACGAQMLSKCPFPTLSEELATALEQRDLVSLLESTSTNDNWTKRHFAQGQLWLVLSLYIHAGDTADGRDKLKVQLDKRRDGGESEEVRYWELGRQLVFEVQPGNIIDRELGVWAWRLKECVRQFFGLDIRGDIHDALREVPPELRGLSSFTAWPRRADDPSANEPLPAEEVAGEARERTDSTKVTTEGDGATGRDCQLPSAGLVADPGDTETQGEDDARQADSSQDLEAATQGPPIGDGNIIADANSQEEVDGVRGEGNKGDEAVGDERRVADAGEATEATDGPQSEGKEAESNNVAHNGGNEGDVVIPMDRLETRSDQPISGA